jgi:hypothetical protein
VIIYLALATYVWFDFARANPDGLANVGLFLITAPVTMVDLIVSALLGQSGALMPDGHGYLADHALYYVPAVAVTALLLWLLARAVERALGRALRANENPPSAP